MKRFFFAGVIFCFFLLGRVLCAQSVLLLKQVLEKAGKNNLALIAARQNLGVFEGGLVSAKAVPNPELDLQIGQVPVHGPEVSDATKDFTFQQTVELWGKRGLRTKSAKSLLESEEAKYQSLELDLFKQVKESYWNLALADERMRFALENLKFQQRFLSRVQENFQVNKANLADLTRAKVEETKAANALLEAQKKLDEAQSNLNRMMGEDIHQQLSEPEPLTGKEIALDEKALVQRALEKRPEKNAVAKLKEGSKSDLALARRLLWAPDLKTQVFYQKQERQDGQSSWGGGLGVVFPLWNQYRGDRLQASAKLNSLKTAADDLNQQIMLEVHQAFQQLKLSGEQIKLWKQTVDQATESARLAQERYLEGESDLLIFFEARRDLVDATLQYLEALKDYRVSQSTLERAVGEDLVS